MRVAAERFRASLRGPQLHDRSEGAFAIMNLCFRLFVQKREITASLEETLSQAGPLLAAMLFEEHSALQFAASWALVWLGACRVWPPPVNPDVLGRLFSLWRNSSDSTVQYMAGWALTTLPLPSRDKRPRFGGISAAELNSLLKQYDQLADETRIAALVVTWYRRGPWDDAKIAARIREIAQDSRVLRYDKDVIDQLLRTSVGRREHSRAPRSSRRPRPPDGREEKSF